MIDKQTKDDFIAVWDSMLPPGVLEHADTPIPELLPTPGGYDSENPTQNSEILSHNLNLIFKAFEGFTPIDLILHIGQKNAVNKAIMLASLEYQEKVIPSYTVVSPLPPEENIYSSGSTIAFAINVPLDTQESTQELVYSCNVIDTSGGDPLDIPLDVDPEDPEQFIGNLTINTPDSWFATFTVSFDGTEIVEEIMFEVQ